MGEEKDTAAQRGLPPAAVLRKLRGELLDLLVELDRVCRKYGIRYYLSSGTLLGAVRHQGFIPWDDDVDIDMLRPDYERFRAAAEKEYGREGAFYFQDSTTDADYNWPYGKFRRAGTHAVRQGQQGIFQRDGIFIDVLVVDVLAPHRPMQSLMYYMAAFARKILWAPVGWRTLKNPFEKVVFYLLHLIPRAAGLALHRWVTGWYRGKGTGYAGVFNTALPRRRGYVHRMEWYENAAEGIFEGRQFPIPAGYDGILKRFYGAYWELPPPEEQRGSSDLESITFSDGTCWKWGDDFLDARMQSVEEIGERS